MIPLCCGPWPKRCRTRALPWRPMQSEQARQWKRERKRLKREGKRRSFPPSLAGGVTVLGLPKNVRHAPGLRPAAHRPAPGRPRARGAEGDAAVCVSLLECRGRGRRGPRGGGPGSCQEAGRIVGPVDVFRDGDELRVTARSTL